MTSHNQYVFIYLHPESESLTASAQPPVVPLGLIKEMDKAMEAMQKKRDADARKHLDKAARISPTNPDVAYLQGMMELDHHNLPVAEQFFQKAVSSSHSQERELLGLGYVQVQMNQAAAAAQTLEKALQMNTTSERGHLLLANAYAQLHEYSKAKEHAQRAAALNSETRPPRGRYWPKFWWRRVIARLQSWNSRECCANILSRRRRPWPGTHLPASRSRHRGWQQ